MASSDPDPRPPGFLSILRSVAAAFFGVQSEHNRERDFRHGKPIHFIVAGLLGTALFVLLMWGLVRLVLGLAGG